MARLDTWILLWWLALATLLGGCHLEQGQLHFDELRLDPITVYKMAPLERTVFCLAQVEIPESAPFDDLHAAALAKVENEPEKADWSDLVCLSLNSRASLEQVRRAINGLQLVLAVQPMEVNPARGFKMLLEQKAALYEDLEGTAEELRRAEQQGLRRAFAYETTITELKNKAAQQREKIDALEQQVRKLKEVELLIHPKQ